MIKFVSFGALEVSLQDLSPSVLEAMSFDEEESARETALAKTTSDLAARLFQTAAPVVQQAPSLDQFRSVADMMMERVVQRTSASIQQAPHAFGIDAQEMLPGSRKGVAHGLATSSGAR
jgi:hypothetical protein